MMNLSRCMAIASVAVCAVSVRAIERAEVQLQSEVTQLKNQVAELEGGQAGIAETAATIEQLLRDAERRSQFLAAGDTSAGYDNGFFIRSGEFVLRPGFQIQFRNVTDYRENTSGGKSDETENGFEIRRLRLFIEGAAFTKNLTYCFVWGTRVDNGTTFYADAGALLIEDAFVRYMVSDDWGFQAGQWKDPVSHEKSMGDRRLLAVERSLVDAIIGGGWTDSIQGVELIYGGRNNRNPANVELVLHDGGNSDNSSYVGHYPNDPPRLGATSGPGGHAFDFGLAGRVDYKVTGDWKTYNDFSVRDVREPLLIVGAGVDWSQGGDGNALQATLDAMYKHPAGFGLYGAILVLNTDTGLSAITGSAGSPEAQTDWGFVLQASHLLNPSWELVARYSYVGLDTSRSFTQSDSTTRSIDTLHEITVGVAYYLGENGSAGHRAKVNVDLNWLPHGAPKSLGLQDYLGDSAGEAEIVLRAQFQFFL